MFYFLCVFAVKLKKTSILFNYVATQIAGYRGWILQQYNVASFRERLEELLGSNFPSQTLPDVNLHSKSADREVYGLKTPPAEVYLKRYFTVTWKQTIQTLFHVHKAQKSWRIGISLSKRGVSTPLPIAYITRRKEHSKFAVEHILVTQGITNGVRLSDYVHQGLSLTEKRGLIRSMAEFLAQLHVAGVYHGDLTARNILVEEGRGSVQGSPTPAPSQAGSGLTEIPLRVYLIDLDAVRSTHWISDACRMKNLDELGRNFLDLRVLSTSDRGRFLQSYLKANPKETRTFKQLFRCVFQRAQEQLRKNGKQFVYSGKELKQCGAKTPLHSASFHSERAKNQECNAVVVPPLFFMGVRGWGNWNLHVLPRWKETFPTIAKVFEILSQPVQIVHENNRGVVLLIRHNGTLFVAKRSKIQEHKRWAQFTSLYRQGEGTRLLRNLTGLYALGLPVPEPVLVLEKKVGGFVVASWSLYCYLEGQPCSCAQSHLIAETLKELHQNGWVHRDPHVKNFLWNGAKVCILDCAKARPWRSRYAQMYDVVLLDNCCPGSLKYYGISASDGVYRLAKGHNNLIKLWRRIKRTIRSRPT